MIARDKKTILLADHDFEVLSMEKGFFDNNEYNILTARDPLETYELTLLNHPDIIFIEFEIDKIRGDELCERIKSNHKVVDPIVVLVTEDLDIENTSRCIACNCNDIILKSSGKNAFIESLKNNINFPGRRTPRIKTHFQVSYGWPGDTDDLTNYILNISTGGLFIETETPLPENTPLVMTFSISPSDRKPFVVKGEVAWINTCTGPNKNLPSGMGIKFTDLSLDKILIVRKLIEASLSSINNIQKKST